MQRPLRKGEGDGHQDRPGTPSWTRSLFEGIPVPAYIWREDAGDFVLVDFNPAAEIASQGRVRDYVGSHASSVYADEPGILSDIRRAGGQRVRLERVMPYRIPNTEEDYILHVTYHGLPTGQVIVYTQDQTPAVRTREALHTKDRLYRDLFEGSRDAIYITDTDGAIVDVNQAALDLFGYSRSETLVTNARDLYADPKDRDRFQAAILASGSVKDFAVRLLGKGGRQMDCLITSTGRTDPDGKIVGYQGIIRDVTQQKQNEARIRRQLERLRILQDVNLAITASVDPQVTLDIILSQVTGALGLHAADILLLDRTSNLLRFVAGRGFRTAALRHTQLRMGEGYAGEAALNRRTVSLPELSEADFSRSPLLHEESFLSYFAVPLLAKGSVSGVLEVFHRSLLAADPEWIEFLEALATQAAIAIDNAALFDELQRSNTVIVRSYDATLEGWARALELRDQETLGHTRRVAEMTLRLARHMGVPERDLVDIHRGALLHDIGKMGIPDHILRKPGPLSEEEWTIMRKHPEYAFELLAPIDYLRQALDIPYAHHEKYDGTGYPRGLKGRAIPLAARIFSVVDVWDALQSDRPYRRAWPRAEALGFLHANTGSHFDPAVVAAFVRLMGLEV